MSPKHLGSLHPDFHYPESRNPYWAKLKAVEGGVYSDNRTEAYRGHWREKFPDTARAGGDRLLHLELGCNAGHVSLEWAARNPKDAFIGIDWKFKMIFKGLEK